jgi:hypothetical protein
MPESNRDRLREAGLIADTALRDELYEFIDSLSDDEVNVLVRLKERLDEQNIPTVPLSGKAVAGPVL